MFQALKIKVVYACTKCGHTERLLNLTYALRGLRSILSNEGQELSSKIARGEATNEEVYRYHKLCGPKRLLVCCKCRMPPAQWSKSWNFGTHGLNDKGPS